MLDMLRLRHPAIGAAQFTQVLAMPSPPPHPAQLLRMRIIFSCDMSRIV